MNEEQNNNLPKYIEDLLKLSRSNIEKLIAAWDGLSVETQIQVLTTINERSANYEFSGNAIILKDISKTAKYRH